ncbi:unnamed protein product [Linum trigynum]|uniref:Uncharacterized protein n=1 Tax=Linum trigynum TaxID=586398 RepID=A0AAV2GSY0_9ROSI
MLGTSLVAWKAKKQETVAKSSSEVEDRALSKLASKVVWLKVFLQELGVPRTARPWCFYDNRSNIHVAENLVFHKPTKHIEVYCHFIRHHFQSKLITLDHVVIKVFVVDLFTKALRRR